MLIGYIELGGSHGGQMSKFFRQREISVILLPGGAGEFSPGKEGQNEKSFWTFFPSAFGNLKFGSEE